MISDYLKKLYSAYKENGTQGFFDELRKHFFIISRIRHCAWCSWIWARGGHNSDADPSKIIYVDPKSISNLCAYWESTWKLEIGKVYDGRWDRLTSPFTEKPVVRALRNHLTRRNNSYFDSYVGLCDKIKKEGYKTQRELLMQNKTQTLKRNNDGFPVHLNEIKVLIARDGELFWATGGQHRLCIAQYLSLKQVPVQVLVRHKKWQDIRDEVRNVSRVEDLSSRARNHLNHPDLKDVVTDKWLN